MDWFLWLIVVLFCLWLVSAALLKLLVAVANPIFVVTHLCPLTPSALAEVASTRRDREIGRRFTFDAGEAPVNAEFKNRMDATGQFYTVAERLRGFPATAAGLLKYKKHEWMIFALANGDVVRLMWVNKGPDRTQVAPLVALEGIGAIAVREACDSVLVFHNHPNGSVLPSPQDQEFSRGLLVVLAPLGLNVLEFVCAGGWHSCYSSHIPETFLPVSGFLEQVSAENAEWAMGNLALHRERFTTYPRVMRIAHAICQVGG